MHVIPALSDPVERSEALWALISSPNKAAGVAILAGAQKFRTDTHSFGRLKSPLLTKKSAPCEVDALAPRHCRVQCASDCQ